MQLILSDIHSNLPALEAAVRYMKRTKCEFKIISLGDQIGSFAPKGWFQFRLKLAHSKCFRFHKALENAEFEARRKAKLWLTDQRAKEILEEGL